MIRPARLEDAPAIRALLVDNGLTIDGLAYEAFTPPCLVAVRDGVVIGMGQALLGLPYCVVTELVVARSAQRQGVAVRLLEHLETVMRTQGATAWVACTSPKNDRVNAQLERYGARGLGHGLGWVKPL